MMRVGIYARVSTRDKDQTPENQLIRLREYCTFRHWEWEEYVDYASGADATRPELNRLMLDLPKLNGILVSRLDRFGRSVSDLTMRLATIRDRGLFFEAIDQGLRLSGDKSDAVSSFTFHVLAATAEFEREIIRDRINDGIARARRHGVKIGRPRITEVRGVSPERIIELRREGRSIREIAMSVGIGRMTVHRIIASQKPDGKKDS
jgi:DNA invertase Pin-like site-specific DNA recombinase